MFSFIAIQKLKLSRLQNSWGYQQSRTECHTDLQPSTVQVTGPASQGSIPISELEGLSTTSFYLQMTAQNIERLEYRQQPGDIKPVRSVGNVYRHRITLLVPTAFATGGVPTNYLDYYLLLNSMRFKPHHLDGRRWCIAGFPETLLPCILVAMFPNQCELRGSLQDTGLFLFTSTHHRGTCPSHSFTSVYNIKKSPCEALILG